MLHINPLGRSEEALNEAANGEMVKIQTAKVEELEPFRVTLDKNYATLARQTLFLTNVADDPAIKSMREIAKIGVESMVRHWEEITQPTSLTGFYGPLQHILPKLDPTLDSVTDQSTYFKLHCKSVKDSNIEIALEQTVERLKIPIELVNGHVNTLHEVNEAHANMIKADIETSQKTLNTKIASIPMCVMPRGIKRMNTKTANSMILRQYNNHEKVLKFLVTNFLLDLEYVSVYKTYEIIIIVNHHKSSSMTLINI